jgi:cellulose synthase/poly-beta-1,6-N-acetylglucosamine synthase-like glycosyltransferase
MFHFYISLDKVIIEIVLWGLLVFPFLLALVDSFFRGLFLLIIAFPIGHQKEKNAEIKSPNLRLLIMVVANNEERIIARTLQLILQAINGAQFATLALLADNCTDQTAQIASSLGVKTYDRMDGDPGKGKALSWFTTKNASISEQYDLIAILDADTIILNNFVHQVQLEFLSADVKVIQTYVQPLVLKNNPIIVLAGYSEILAQKIDDLARSYLGWSVPLKGKGSIFRIKIFQEISRGLSTQVDDIEMSFCLAENNVSVRYCPMIHVIDSNTDIVFGLARQRGRWLIGQRQIQRQLKNNFFKLLCLGPSAWSVIHAMLMKPKIAVLLIKFMLLVLTLFWSLEDRYFFLIKTSLVLCIFIDLLYYLIGLRLVENGLKYFGALLTAPIYLLFWLISYFYSIIPGQKWLRAREE